ncbi:hypothetical protein QCA50_000242 [Cerrena zonata]|uniref:AB hydrolase-1 domain-containing protein n=1 Tax=Cerrena zonata TaxID=2478898 RepID=A0AAW0GSI0_9APHY
MASSATSSASSLANSMPSLPPARDIPSSFTASLKSWWSLGEKEGAASEERLLRNLSYFRPAGATTTPDESSPVVAHSSRVELSDPKKYINTFTIESTSPSPSGPPPAVVLHGYGAGLGFFFQNFPALGRWAGNRGTSVYAIDWLGMGRSARIPFRVKAKREDIRGRVAEAESFFIDSLEEWRTKMGLEKMTLIGHSLGGYLSIAYALKYPTRVSKLILVSPAGIPRDPNNTTEYSREVADPQVTGASDSDHAEAASKSTVESMRAEQRTEQRKESRSRRLFTYLWEEGFSPFQVVRSLTFWGPMLVGKYSSRRFIGLSADDTKAMHEYILNITMAKGSGEYCICAFSSLYSVPLVISAPESHTSAFYSTSTGAGGSRPTADGRPNLRTEDPSNICL